MDYWHEIHINTTTNLSTKELIDFFENEFASHQLVNELTHSIWVNPDDGDFHIKFEKEPGELNFQVELTNEFNICFSSNSRLANDFMADNRFSLAEWFLQSLQGTRKVISTFDTTYSSDEILQLSSNTKKSIQNKYGIEKIYEK